MSIALLSIDLAKNIFQLHGADERGRQTLSRRVSRGKLLETVISLPRCRIVMEACGGAHYWARKFTGMGHHVQIIAPRFVKPFVKSQKNDRNDAEAIAEAASRPTMRYVTVNSVEQQDIQSMHRIRSLLMRDRIAQINQIRGLLAEYGVVIAQTPPKVRQQLPAILDDQDNELTELTRSMMRDMYERLTLLDTQIERYDELIRQAHKASVLSQRLEKIRGVGPMIATAVIAAAGSATEFANGRQFAAWLGLTPRQHSSGGQAAPVWDHEAGQRVSSDASGTRRKISRSAGSETQRWTFAMDSRGAGETGNERRRRGACEQDSPHDLGVAGPREGIRTASMTRA